MGIYAVSREAGPSWTEGKGAPDQPGREAHVTYMEGLAREGLIVFAGPLADSHAGRIRVLLIAEASSEAEVAERIAGDPWEQEQRITTTRIEPWTLILGAKRWPSRPET